jgi:hypothetical protein
VRFKIQLITGLLLTTAIGASVVQVMRGQEVKKSSDVAVIVNPQNTLDDIKLAVLRKVVLGDLTFWPNHSSIALVLRPTGTPEQDTMLKTIAGMNDSQFRQFWSTKVFRGEVPAEPLVVPSNGMAIEYVATHRGAVAFLRGRDTRSDLKILKVDGMLPGDDHYPLH